MRKTDLKVEQIAQQGTTLFSTVLFSIIIIIPVTTPVVSSVIIVAWRVFTAIRVGPGGCRLWPFCRSRALDDLVELATVKPDPTALWAIVDFDTTAVSHDKGFTIYGAFH